MTQFRDRIRAFSSRKRALLARRLGGDPHHGSTQRPAASAQRLVAYIVADEGQAPAGPELRSFLEDQLPDYMIPSDFVLLDAMPRTPSGKIDRNALPVPDGGQRHLQGGFVAAQSPIEELLVGIWAEVLGVESIGTQDHFFDLGGHSLSATQLIARVRDTFSLEIPVRWIFDYPTVSRMAEEIGNRRSDIHHVELTKFEPVPRVDDLPLSFSQERVWFIHQLACDSLAYCFPTSIHFNGALDVAVLETCLNEIVERHEIYRTTFPAVDGIPVQVIHEPEPARLPLIKLDELDERVREKETQRLIGEQLHKPFDVTKLPLIRWTLLRLAPDEHVLIHIEHHLVHDGWSLNVFLRELLELYRAYSVGESSSLPAPSIQFADYACWQREWIKGEPARKQLDYWKKQLAGSPAVLELPADRPRPTMPSFRGSTPRLEVPFELCGDLRAFSRQEGVTLFMTMFTAFVTLLHRYTGQADICVGSGVANRGWQESEALLGMLVNNVVLRADLSGGPTFRELLQQVRETTLEAYAHQDLPFERVVETLQPTRDLSYNPLFQVIFSFHDSPMPAVQLPGLAVHPKVTLNNSSAKFDLNVVVVPHSEQQVGLRPGSHGDGLTVLWEYSTDLFDASTMERMIGHYQTLLQDMVANPDRRIFDLSLLTAPERRLIVEEWNGAPSVYPRDLSIHSLFEAQVKRAPGATAVVHGDELTYAQLNSRANQLARHLCKNGVEPGALVGICLDRSADMVVGLLATLKAGGAYVPLDPSYPTERLEYMISDTRAPVVLTQSQLADRLPQHRTQVICLDTESSAIGRESEDDLPSRSTASSLAYVIYTSGSTGQPKGTSIPHRAVNRLVLGSDFVQLNASDRVAQVSNVSFDAATFEIWGALLNGGSVVEIDRDVSLSPTQFVSALRDNGVTTLFLTTALFNQMARETPGAFRTLRHVLFGGEACAPDCVRSVLENEPPERLLHVYGPTENTTFTTWHLVREVPDDATTVPIGRSISGSTVYVLDEHMAPVPVGVPGELYTGGDGLAQEYLNQPELTAEKFVADPFNDSEARLYRTGDLCRWREDGTIEFIGRRDSQVKIRGFRVELSEIELALSDIPSVSEAVASVREDEPGDKSLVAYVVPQDGRDPTAAELRRFLSERLPGYMVPSACVQLDSIPLSPNGKIDRSALPALVGAPSNDGSYVAPESITERAIDAIWKDVLQLEQIGVHDDFFDLGGHSLLVMRVISRLQQAFDVNLTVTDLFEMTTIADLAAGIDTLVWARQTTDEGAKETIRGERGQI